jgi:phosphatidate cytidylyltransferase
LSAFASAPHAEKLSPLRIVIAVVLCPTLGLILFRLPMPVFAALAALVGTVALREVHFLSGMAMDRFEWLATGVSVAVGISFYSAESPLVAAVFALGSVLLFTNAVLRSSESWREAFQWIFAAIFGLVYVVAPLGLLLLLRATEMGAHLVTIVVLATWARDIGAFLTGRVLKGRPIRPDLNAQKHWLGALGGLVLATLTVAGLNRLLEGPLGAGDTLAIGVLIGIFGQVGDLFESLLKRQAGARHSGVFLPDQGGLLDSIDGLLFTAPVTTMYLLVFRHVGRTLGLS